MVGTETRVGPARWRPGNLPLFVQVVALLIGALVLAQLVLVAVVLSTQQPRGPSSWVSDAARALSGRGEPAGIDLVLSRAPGPPADDYEDAIEREYRLLLAHTLNTSPDRVRVVLRAAVPGQKPERHIPVAAPGLPIPHGPGTLLAALQQPNGQWLIARERTGGVHPWQRRLIFWILATFLVLLPLAWVFARGITQPIKRFAEAAERLGRDPSQPPLALAGPAELGTAAQAMNVMQDRLRRYVEDRTAMIGAIAHDLRTPLTRLRFRLDGVPDTLREKTAGDIAEMEAMIGAVLAFVREAGRRGAREPLELRSLLDSIADNMTDVGHEVSVSGEEDVVLAGDAVALRALFANLLDNAVHYGARARVMLRREGRTAVVEIDDDGPGIPEAERERVFEPFQRLEPSRNRHTGGIGLGLAVARAHALAHGGTVTLGTRPEGGLRAVVTLPL